jgi:hypothetical protein
MNKHTHHQLMNQIAIVMEGVPPTPLIPPTPLGHLTHLTPYRRFRAKCLQTTHHPGTCVGSYSLEGMLVNYVVLEWQEPLQHPGVVCPG